MTGTIRLTLDIRWLPQAYAYPSRRGGVQAELARLLADLSLRLGVLVPVRWVDAVRFGCPLALGGAA